MIVYVRHGEADSGRNAIDIRVQQPQTTAEPNPPWLTLEQANLTTRFLPRGNPIERMSIAMRIPSTYLGVDFTMTFQVGENISGRARRNNVVDLRFKTGVPARRIPR